MKNFSAMSRAELIGELTGSSDAAIAADMPGVYLASGDLRQRCHGDELVAGRLAAARELLLRDLAAQMKSGPILNSPHAVRDWLRLRYAGVEHEVFLVLHLDVKHRLIEAEEMFRGTLTHTSVYPREVVKSALERNAAALIFAHNHPSGESEPSQADRMLTQHLKSALALIDLRVTDHFVIAGDSVLSFAEQGLL